MCISSQHTPTYTHTHIYKCARIHTHVHTHAHSHGHAHMRTDTPTHSDAYTYECIHTVNTWYGWIFDYRVRYFVLNIFLRTHDCIWVRFVNNLTTCQNMIIPLDSLGTVIASLSISSRIWGWCYCYLFVLICRQEKVIMAVASFLH